MEKLLFIFRKNLEVDVRTLSDGCRRFAPGTELEGGNEKERSLAEGDREATNRK
jgi:hypothetical protein